MTTLDDAIERRSIRAELVRRIRAAIIYGEIEPGRIHSAPALAARLGVSITPVREALLELASRGMVLQVRNRGFQVVERTPEDLDAALELRALVEIPTMVRLAGHLDDAAADHFGQLVDDGIAAARGGDLSTFLDLDRQFHLGLLQRAGNPRVVDVVDQVLDHLRLVVFAGEHAPASVVHVAEQHAEILDAVVSDDPDAVESAIRRHFETTRTAWRVTPPDA